jgi:hypothetical protein
VSLVDSSRALNKFDADLKTFMVETILSAVFKNTFVF